MTKYFGQTFDYGGGREKLSTSNAGAAFVLPLTLMAVGLMFGWLLF